VEPPLEIMDETIYDHRSQYPVPIDLTLSSQQRASQPLVIPVEISLSTNTKKRAAAAESANAVEDTDTKRMCSDNEVKKLHVEENKAPAAQVSQQQQPIKSNGSTSGSTGGSSKQFGK
jgi:hypothetical protein